MGYCKAGRSRKTSYRKVCSDGINLFRALITYLQPVLPEVAAHAEEFLNTKLDFFTLDNPLVFIRSTSLSLYSTVLRRLRLMQ